MLITYKAETDRGHRNNLPNKHKEYKENKYFQSLI